MPEFVVYQIGTPGWPMHTPRVVAHHATPFMIEKGEGPAVLEDGWVHSTEYPGYEVRPGQVVFMAQVRHDANAENNPDWLLLPGCTCAACRRWANHDNWCDGYGPNCDGRKRHGTCSKCLHIDHAPGECGYYIGDEHDDGDGLIPEEFDRYCNCGEVKESANA